MTNETLPDVPDLAELLAAPKTFPINGRGVGGRPFVLDRGELRKPVPADRLRTACPFCTTDQVAVLTEIAAPRPGTIPIGARHRCPRCRFEVDLLVASLLDDPLPGEVSLNP